MSEWSELTGYERNRGNDTAAERQAASAMVPQKRSEHSTGYTGQMADVMTQDVMARAMADKLSLAQRETRGAEAEAAAEEEAGRRGDIDPAREDEIKDDDDLEVLRSRRRQQMKERFEKEKEYAALGHGAYDEIVEEEFLKTVTSSKRAIVHFYHRSFERCKIIDMHLQRCARRFNGTRFVKLDSEKAPFFVAKLQVKTLPCCVVFFDGVAKFKQIGFNGLPSGDESRTAELAWTFKEHDGIEEDFGPDDDIE